MIRPPRTPAFYDARCRFEEIPSTKGDTVIKKLIIAAAVLSLAAPLFAQAPESKPESNPATAAPATAAPAAAEVKAEKKAAKKMKKAAKKAAHKANTAEAPKAPESAAPKTH